MQYKPKRSEGGEQGQGSQVLMAKGKYRGIITKIEDVSGDVKKGERAGSKWYGTRFHIDYPDEKITDKWHMVFERETKVIASLLEARGIEIEDGMTVDNDSLLGPILVYVDVTKDGKYNNIERFAPAPVRKQ